MQGPSDLTLREQKMLGNHLKFGERRRRHGWLFKMAFAGLFLLVALHLYDFVCLAREALGTWASFQLANDSSSAEAFGYRAMAEVSRAGLQLIVAFFFAVTIVWLRQSFRDNTLIVKLHGLLRQAGGADPLAGPEAQPKSIRQIE